jgi:hypothetical protein
MATFILPVGTHYGSTNDVFYEPAATNFGSNDRYPIEVVVFKDTATRIGLGFAFRVPQNYATGGTTKFLVEWATTATSGTADWEIDYTAVADNETLDPSSDQEALAATGTAPGTARLREVTELTATAGNFAAGDIVIGTLFRDGADADTVAASLYLFGLYFSYTDA